MLLPAYISQYLPRLETKSKSVYKTGEKISAASYIQWLLL